VRESTVILVTADHGEEFQEHGRLGHGTQLYDELLRVPLVIAGPGIVPGRVAEQAQGIDVFPTVSALLGLPPPPGLEGQNVLAAWESAAPSPPVMTYYDPAFPEKLRALGYVE